MDLDQVKSPSLDYLANKVPVDLEVVWLLLKVITALPALMPDKCLINSRAASRFIRAAS